VRYARDIEKEEVRAYVREGERGRGEEREGGRERNVRRGETERHLVDRSH
jgi:hypothetical protein